VPLKATNPVFRAKTERFREALRLLHASTTGSAQRMVKAVAKASGLTLIHPLSSLGTARPDGELSTWQVASPGLRSSPPSRC
jgi:hypothetical protein